MFIFPLLVPLLANIILNFFSLLFALWIIYLGATGQSYEPSGAESGALEFLDPSNVCESASKKILELKDVKDSVSENAVNVKDPAVIKEPINVAATKCSWMGILFFMLSVGFITG